MYQSPHMIQYDGSIDAKWVLLFLLFFLVSLISACGGNEAIDSQQVEAEPEEPSLTAREWYPTSKYQQQAPPAYAPSAIPTAPAMTAPAASGLPTQQPWAVSTPQPVYVAPQVVYQAQPLQQGQQPSVWSTQSPAVTQQPQGYWYQPAPQAQVQQQPGYYYYQPVQRPWGNSTQPADPQRSAITTDAWPQGGYIVAPWGVPATGFNGSGAATGQVVQPQWTPNYGHPW